MSRKKKEQEQEPPADSVPVPPLRPHFEGRSQLLKNLYPVLPAGAISLLSGASGAGKTAIMAMWCRAWLDGQEWFGHKPGYELPKIGIVMTDRRFQRARYWFDKVGLTEDERFQMYCLQDDLGMNWDRIRNPKLHLTAFKDALGKLGEIPLGTLLIVDPISPFLGGKLNDYSHTAAAIGPLQQYIASLGATCLGTHHTSKVKQDKAERHVRPQDRILGSTALTGYTDSQLYLVGPEETEQPWGLVGIVPHDFAPQEYKVVRDPRNGLFQYLGQVTEDEKVVMKAGGEGKPFQVPIDNPEVLAILTTISPDSEGTKAATIFNTVTSALTMAPATLKRRLEQYMGWGWIVKIKYGVYRRLVTLPSEVQS